MNEAHPHDTGTVTRINADGDGLPCFGCYFGAVYDALRPEHLSTAEPEPGTDDEEAEVARRLGGTLAYLADGIAAITVNAAGAEAAELLEVFMERVRNMVTLVQAPCDDQAH